MQDLPFGSNNAAPDGQLADACGAALGCLSRNIAFAFQGECSFRLLLLQQPLVLFASRTCGEKRARFSIQMEKTLYIANFACYNTKLC